MTLSVSNQHAPQASMSLTERASQNFTNHKWEIIAPGPMGLAYLVATIVFFVSNPFGWAFSAGLVGTGIALASLSAIGAIGYSLYHLLKEPNQIKNLVTKEEEKPIVLIPPTLIYRKAAAEPAEQIEGAPSEQPAAPKSPERLEGEPLAAPKKKPARKPAAPVAAPAPAAAPAIIGSAKLKDYDSLKSKIKRFARTILSNPKKSALALGGILLSAYGLYNYLTPAALPTMRNFTFANPLAEAAAQMTDKCPNPMATCLNPHISKAVATLIPVATTFTLFPFWLKAAEPVPAMVLRNAPAPPFSNISSTAVPFAIPQPAPFVPSPSPLAAAKPKPFAAPIVPASSPMPVTPASPIPLSTLSSIALIASSILGVHLHTIFGG